MVKDGGIGEGEETTDGRVGAQRWVCFAVLQNGPVVCRTRLTGLPAISVRMEST